MKICAIFRVFIPFKNNEIQINLVFLMYEWKILSQTRMIFPHVSLVELQTMVPHFLGGLSLHLNHLIASRTANYDWPFGTLPFGFFGSNLDTRDLETSPRTYSGDF